MSRVAWDERRPFPIDHEGPRLRAFDPIDQAWMGRPLLDRFEHICERFADRIAVDDGVFKLSYADLRQRAYALAKELAKTAQSDRPVAAIIPGNAVYPIALLATLALGRNLTPIDVTHPYPRKAAILEETKPGLVLLAAGEDPEPGLLPDDLPRLFIDLTAPPAQAAKPDFAPLSSLSGIAFTSGSTGRPKGLAFDQAGILAFVAEYVNAQHVNEDDVILAIASLAAGGNLAVLGAVTTGARVRMIDIKAAGIDGTLNIIEADKVTLMSMIPLVYRALFQHPEARTKVRSLRTINSGGDRLLGADVKLFRSVLSDACHIRTTQGSTESTGVFHWYVPRDMTFDDQATVPSGYLAEGKAVGLVGAEGLDEPFEGEFLVRGAHLAAGGWQDGRLTPGPFVPDETDPARKVFDTGDVVRRAPGGLYEFVGRRDRQIKILGLRADPADVEAILRTTPGVGDVVVIPRRGEGDAVFVAYVVPLDLHKPPSGEALQSAVAAAAQPHLVPAEVRFLPAIPRLPNYKPDYVALEALDRANRPASAAAPRSSVESHSALDAAVREAWDITLGQPVAKNEQPWNRSGGDSLKAMQFMLRLEERLGQKLPFDLFDANFKPSAFVQSLAAFLSGEDHGGPEDAPLVFLCPGIGGDDTRLAGFRRALSDRLRFQVIAYPGLERSAAQLGERENLIAAAIEQIETARPTGPLRLAGYSIGGLVAYEAAVRLAAKGRTIERLCILDSDASIRVPDRWKIKSGPLQEIAWVRSNAKAFGLSTALQEWVISRLLRHQQFGLLRALILWRNRRPGRGSVYARQLLVERLHGRAFIGWRPKPYPGEMWLIRALEQDAAAPRDLEWGPYVAKLHVLDTPGDHKSMLIAPYLPALCDNFEEVMAYEKTPEPA